MEDFKFRDPTWNHRVPMRISFHEMYLLALCVKMAVVDPGCPEETAPFLRHLGLQMAQTLLMCIDEITPETAREDGWDRAFGLEV